MEPASYQQHVSSRHAGFSATFGCSYCRFDTKSSDHFRKHMLKHLNTLTRHPASGKTDPCNINIVKFLIDDENGKIFINLTSKNLGRGYCLNGKEVQTTQKSSISSSTLHSNTAFLECGPDFFKAPLTSKTKSSNNTINSRLSSKNLTSKSINRMRKDTKYIHIIREPDEEYQEYEEYLVKIDDEEDALNVPEIQNEVIIDESETDKAPQQKEEIDDFGLD